MICNNTVKTRSQSAIVLVSYNDVYITWSIIGRLRYINSASIHSMCYFYHVYVKVLL